MCRGRYVQTRKLKFIQYVCGLITRAVTKIQDPDSLPIRVIATFVSCLRVLPGDVMWNVTSYPVNRRCGTLGQVSVYDFSFFYLLRSELWVKNWHVHERLQTVLWNIWRHTKLGGDVEPWYTFLCKVSAIYFYLDQSYSRKSGPYLHLYRGRCWKYDVT